MPNGGNPSGGGHLRSNGGGGRARSIGGGGLYARLRPPSSGSLAIGQSLNGESDNDLANADQLLQDKESREFISGYFFFGERIYQICEIAPADQANCNACWAAASVGAITSRLCKAVRDASYYRDGGQRAKHPLRLNFFRSRDESAHISVSRSGSPMSVGGLGIQPPLSCSEKNMDCNIGGYPADVYQWVKDNYLQPDGCAGMEYKSGKGAAVPCTFNFEDNKCKGYNRVTLGNAGWITGEANMRKAIWEGGPITSIIRLTEGLLNMTVGLLNNEFNKTTVTYSVSEAARRQWDLEDKCASTAGCQKPLPAYHVIQVVGWERTSFDSVWIIQNSWGGMYPSWKTVGGVMVNVQKKKEAIEGTLKAQELRAKNYRGPFLRIRRGDDDELGIQGNPSFLADIMVWNGYKKVPISRETWMNEYTANPNGK